MESEHRRDAIFSYVVESYLERWCEIKKWLKLRKVI